MIPEITLANGRESGCVEFRTVFRGNAADRRA